MYTNTHTHKYTHSQIHTHTKPYTCAREKEKQCCKVEKDKLIPKALCLVLVDIGFGRVPSKLFQVLVFQSKIFDRNIQID